MISEERPEEGSRYFPPYSGGRYVDMEEGKCSRQKEQQVERPRSKSKWTSGMG